MLVLLIIDSQKHFDTTKLPTKEEKIDHHFAYSVISYNNLKDSYMAFCKKARLSMHYRLTRDKAFIKAIDAHVAAVELSKVMPDFRCSDNFENLTVGTNSIKAMKPDPDVIELIHTHIVQTKNMRYVPREKNRNYLRDEREKFGSRLRNPSVIYKQQGVATDTTKLEKITQHQKAGDSALARINLIPS